MAEPIIQHLFCSKCMTSKVETDFFHRPKSPRGFTSWCKSCIRLHAQTVRGRKKSLSNQHCACGCGQYTEIATRSYGAVKAGSARQFVQGHSLKLPNPNRLPKNTQSSFWERVQRGPSCWEWQGRRDKLGYGHFRFNGKSHLAHRLAYAFSTGHLSGSDLIRHKCDNPHCVRPDHLEIGNSKDNIHDAIIRARSGKHWLASLAPEQVRQARQMHASGSKPRTIATTFGVSINVIYCLLKGQTYKHVIS